MEVSGLPLVATFVVAGESCHQLLRVLVGNPLEEALGGATAQHNGGVAAM